ncbi:hypothetical protein H0H92_016110 [Tricholoma furcatifolium]|nr:hypothetical protein H0H92_016110 [Tricholoma furcatifolium]
MAARASIRRATVPSDSEIEEVDAPTQPQTKKRRVRESDIEEEPRSKSRKASAPSGSSGSRAPPPAPPSMPNAAMLENLLKQWAIEKGLIPPEQERVQRSQGTSISRVVYNNTTSEEE